MGVYLDCNATTPLLPAARAAWLAVQDQGWGNPASVHAAGQQARHLLDQAKGRIAGLLGCRIADLVCTSGGSEANALAIHAACAVRPGQGPILVSAIEHSSVLRNAERAGQVQQLGVDRAGRVRLDRFTEAVTPHARLVCLQYANNELGTLQDIPALVAVVRAQAPGALILLDCCQGVGKSRIDLRALGVDFASIAGHKCGAPKGVGLLYARAGVRVDPLIAGGRQQQDRRSGSEDVAGVCALAAALDSGLAQVDQEEQRQRSLLSDAWRALARALPQACWVAADAPRLSNTLSLAHPGISNEHLVARLDLAGIEVSTGAACMASRGEPSHVIAALGLDRELARSVIRVSIGTQTSGADLEHFVTAYVQEVTALLALDRGGAVPAG
jgi:cysteine desulfurase